jgi:hypothetical protein
MDYVSCSPVPRADRAPRRRRRPAIMGWQDGYGAFSIGESQRDDLVRYIRNQKEHHRTRSFKEELIALCERYGVEYDPKHIWT